MENVQAAWKGFFFFFFFLMLLYSLHRLFCSRSFLSCVLCIFGALDKLIYSDAGRGFFLLRDIRLRDSIRGRSDKETRRAWLKTEMVLVRSTCWRITTSTRGCRGSFVRWYVLEKSRKWQTPWFIDQQLAKHTEAIDGGPAYWPFSVGLSAAGIHGCPPNTDLLVIETVVFRCKYFFLNEVRAKNDASQVSRRLVIIRCLLIDEKHRCRSSRSINFTKFSLYQEYYFSLDVISVQVYRVLRFIVSLLAAYTDSLIWGI